MAKNKPSIPSVRSIPDTFKKGKFLPVYFLFGSDLFAVDGMLNEIQNAAAPYISSDFDREIITAEKNTQLSAIIDSAMAFPFGSGKKIIILKNFERITDKKNLITYLENPADFTILVIINYDAINDFSKEPYNELIKNNFIFEAKELRGADLVKWIMNESARMGMNIPMENAHLLVDFVGEDKSLLEMHIQKFNDYLNDSKEITVEVIEKLSSHMKSYSIFDLQDAIGRGDKSLSLKIMYNLLDNGTELIYIISMLNRFITTVAQSIELNKKNIPSKTAAKSLGLSEYYYIKCANSHYFRDHNRLLNSSRALFNTDYALKTSQTDTKILASILISEMLS